jgi:hypothetical protein
MTGLIRTEREYLVFSGARPSLVRRRRSRRLRPAVLDGLNALGVSATAPREPGREAVSREWESAAVPNVDVDWRRQERWNCASRCRMANRGGLTPTLG